MCFVYILLFIRYIVSLFSHYISYTNISTLNDSFFSNTYWLNNKEYIILIPKKMKKIRRIKTILDHNHKDITNTILKYAGPYYDFNNVSIRPSDIGYKTITYIDNDNTITTITQDLPFMPLY